MEQFDKLTWIAGGFLFLAALAIGVPAFTNVLLQIDVDVDNSQSEEFRKAIVAENMLNLRASSRELSATSTEYDYHRQKAVLPVEYFTNENPEGGEIGFSRQDGDCYIEDVAGLNGADFGFYIRPLVDVSGSGANNPRDIPCISDSDITDAFSVPALLVRDARDNPRLPVRIYVYAADGEAGPNEGSSQGAEDVNVIEVDMDDFESVDSTGGGFTFIGYAEDDIPGKAYLRYDPSDGGSSTGGSGSDGCEGRVISGIPLSGVSGSLNECAHSGIVTTPEGDKKAAICEIVDSDTVRVGVGSPGVSSSQLCQNGGEVN